jgi:CRP-like cAMP-binding protein
MTKRLRSLKDIVHNLEVRESLPFIGNGAYLALVSGFLMTDMLHLRVALVGGYTGLVAFHALHPKPLKIPLLWSAVFVVVNAGAAVLLATDRWTGPLSPGDEALYSEHFTRLSRGQFYQLLSLGQRQEIPDGTVLTKEGQVCSKLYFIKKGTAKVYHHEAFAANVDEGGFVNDVAFQQGEIEGAYGTIVTDGDCSVIIWDQKILRDYLASRSDMDRNTKYLLSEHLMRSLLKQREARRWNQKTNGSGILQSVGDIR